MYSVSVQSSAVVWREYHYWHDGPDLITITPHYIHIVLMRKQRPQLLCWPLVGNSTNSEQLRKYLCLILIIKIGF